MQGDRTPLRVLVARPEPQAGATVADLAAAGIDAVAAPMLAIQLEPAATALTLAAAPQALVVTSANGILALTVDGLAEALARLPVVAVGNATAAAARAAGFREVLAAGGNAAAAVAAALAAHPPGTRIVHIAGRDRSGDVAGELSAAGRPATTVEAYRAEPAEHLPAAILADLAAGRFDVVVVGSARTSAALKRCLEAGGLAGPLAATMVAPSAAAAEPLAGWFAGPVVVEAGSGNTLTEGVVALAATVADNRAGDGRTPRDVDDGDRPADQGEREAIMATDNDARGRAGGRRRPKGPTIDLTATEITRDPGASEGGAEAAPEPSTAPAPDQTDADPAAPATVDAAVEAATLAEQPPEDPVADHPVAEPDDPALAAASPDAATPATVTDPDADVLFVQPVESTTPDGAIPDSNGMAPKKPVVDPVAADPAADAADSGETAVDVAPANGDRVTATEAPAAGHPARPPAPEGGRPGLGATLAAAAVGGIVVLAGGLGLYAAGVIERPVAMADLAAVEMRVVAVEDRLAAPPPLAAPDPALTARLDAVEQRLSALPADGGDERLAGVEARLAELAAAAEGRPAPGPAATGGADAEVSARVEALAGVVGTLRSDLEANTTAIAGLSAAPAPDPARIDGLESRLGDLSAALDGLKAEEARSAEELVRLAAQPVVDPARLDALESGVRDLGSRLDGVIAALDETRAALTAATSGLAGVEGRVGPVEQQIADVVARLDAGPKGGEIAALSLAVSGLGSRLAAGLPFAEDLELVRAAAPDAPGLDALSAVAGSGAATLDDLRTSLPVSAMVSARPAEGDGIADRLWSGAKSLVNYRETGADSTDPLSAPLSAIEGALDKGDLAAAAAAAATLPAWAKAPAAGWIARLDARVAADAAVAGLTAHVLERLKAPAEGR